MAGITLETAKRHLDAWLEAELAVTNAQSYTIGSRTMRQNMAAGTVQNDLYHGIYKTLPVIARFGALFPPIARKNGVIL